MKENIKKSNQHAVSGGYNKDNYNPFYTQEELEYLQDHTELWDPFYNPER